MGFYDGAQRPDPDHDPTKELQWEIQRLARSIGTDFATIVNQLIDTVINAVMEGLGGIFSGLIKALLTGDLTDLTDFLTNLPGVGALAEAILGAGSGVAELVSWFTSSFSQLATNIPVLGWIISWINGDVIDSDNPLFVFVKRITTLLHVSDWLAGGFDPAAIWAGIINLFINPLGLITEVGVPALQATWDLIVNVFNGGDAPDSTTGNPFIDAFNAFVGMFNVAGQSQAKNITQDAQITQLLLATSITPPIIENWDGPANTAPDPTNWSVTKDSSRGSGGGVLRTDGSGQLYYQKDGSGQPAGYRLRHKTALTSDYGLVQLVLMSDIPNTTLTLPYVALTCRGNAAETEWVEARFSATTVSFGYVIGGTYTAFTGTGSSASLSGSKAGTWSLKFGTTADNRQFILYRDTTPVLDFTDLSDLSALSGTNNRYVGAYDCVGNQFDPFFGISQVAPPNHGSFAANVRDPAA
jgi:hypothetical protein